MAWSVRLKELEGQNQELSRQKTDVEADLSSTKKKLEDL